MERCATGIDGLDDILEGGIPVGNTLLISGPCGSGKTTLATEILNNGAKMGETGAFISVSDPVKRVIENMKGFEFFDEKLVEDGKIFFFDMSWFYEMLSFTEHELSYDDIDALVGTLEDLVRKLGLKRLVIDSFSGICFRLRTQEKIHEFVYKIARAFSEYGCTCMLVSEIPPGMVKYSSHDVEDLLVDGVILLGNSEQRGYLLRTIQVVKMRGTNHSRDRYVFELSPYGAIIVPLLRSAVE